MVFTAENLALPVTLHANMCL